MIKIACLQEIIFLLNSARTIKLYEPWMEISKWFIRCSLKITFIMSLEIMTQGFVLLMKSIFFYEKITSGTQFYYFKLSKDYWISKIPSQSCLCWNSGVETWKRMICFTPTHLHQTGSICVRVWLTDNSYSIIVVAQRTVVSVSICSLIVTEDWTQEKVITEESLIFTGI